MFQFKTHLQSCLRVCISYVMFDLIPLARHGCLLDLKCAIILFITLHLQDMVIG